MWVGLAEPGEQREPGKPSSISVLVCRLWCPSGSACVSGGARMLLGGLPAMQLDFSDSSG